MRTFRYHRDHPEGVVFDTTGETAPPPPPEINGWFDCRSKLHITQDQLIEALVKNELAKQSSDRPEIEKEFTRKTGQRAHYGAKDKSLIKVVDGK